MDSGFLLVDITGGFGFQTSKYWILLVDFQIPTSVFKIIAHGFWISANGYWWILVSSE